MMFKDRTARDQYGVTIVTEIEEDDKKIEERLHNSLDFYFDVGRDRIWMDFPTQRILLGWHSRPGLPPGQSQTNYAKFSK